MTLKRLIEFSIKERVVVAAIILNTLAIFFRAFPKMHAFESLLLTIDYICCVYFLYEMFCKLGIYGREYFASGWNKLDFIVVVLSLPHLISPFVDVGGFEVVLILRMTRLLRFVQLLRFVPDAERVFRGIQRGLRASIGIALALALYNVVLSLCGCYLFREVAPEAFGDPLLALYSLFKVFTVEGWYEIPDQVAQVGTPMMAWGVRAFFVFAVTTGGLLGFSMANAVFVDEMVRDNNDDLERLVRELSAKVDVLLAQGAKSEHDASGAKVNDDDSAKDDAES